jgi:hypothetical protein
MKPALTPFDPDNPRHEVLITRRRLVEVGGATLVATALFGASGAAAGESRRGSGASSRAGRPQAMAGVTVATIGGGTKPVYVTRAGSQDPVEHSVADTLFWGDIMMEHALFFAMLMPGEALAQQRSRAQQFQRQFAGHLERLRGSRVDRSNYVAMNRATLELVRPFARYKVANQRAQESGELRSLVWPQFFEHTFHEAERFMRRLAQLSGGSAAYSRAEVVPFWSQIMDEHALFIAHLLDPQEQALIETARETSATFRRIRSGGPSEAGGATVQRAVDGIIDFKTAAGRGIQAGQIKSIIDPALADHVRREAVRFSDELARAA